MLEKISYKRNNWQTGMRRVEKIVEEEKKRGYSAFWSGMYSSLPDVIAFDDERLIRVYEVTNYKRPDFYISRQKAERYLNTLLQFKCEKMMVVSFLSNLLDGREYFEQHGIEVQVKGCQD